MAFNSFNAIGLSDRLDVDDILDELDEDDDYGTPPQDRAPKQQQQPDNSKAELERIMAQNRELALKLDNERLASAQRYTEISTRLAQVEQAKKPVTDTKQADELVNNYWQNTQSQQTQANQSPSITLDDIDKRFDQRLTATAEKQAKAAAEEQQLADKFKADHPEILAAGLGPAAYREWTKLQQLRPDLPAIQRYSIMVDEMQNRYKSMGGQKGKFSAPTSETQTVPSSEMEEVFANNVRSERERVRRKAVETARRVKHHRDEQERRTSWIPGET